MKLIDFYTNNVYRKRSRMPKPRGKKDVHGRIKKIAIDVFASLWARNVDNAMLKGENYDN